MHAHFGLGPSAFSQLNVEEKKLKNMEKKMLGSLELLFRNLDSVLDAGVCNDLSEQVCQAVSRVF